MFLPGALYCVVPLLLPESSVGARSHGVGSTFSGIEAIVKVYIHVTGLETDDGSKRGAVGGKASVTFVDVVAVSNRGVDGRCAWCWNPGCARFWIAPRAFFRSAAVTSFGSKLRFYKGLNRLTHGFVVRRAERLKQDLVVAFESERVWNHGIFDE